MFFNFLWDGKPSKIKKSTIIGGIAEGGLKKPFVEEVVKSLKLSWISKLINPTIVERWKKLSLKLMGMSIEDIISKMHVKYLLYN